MGRAPNLASAGMDKENGQSNEGKKDPSPVDLIKGLHTIDITDCNFKKYSLK